MNYLIYDIRTREQICQIGFDRQLRQIQLSWNKDNSNSSTFGVIISAINQQMESKAHMSESKTTIENVSSDFMKAFVQELFQFYGVKGQ